MKVKIFPLLHCQNILQKLLLLIYSIYINIYIYKVVVLNCMAINDDIQRTFSFAANNNNTNLYIYFRGNRSHKLYHSMSCKSWHRLKSFSSHSLKNLLFTRTFWFPLQPSHRSNTKKHLDFASRYSEWTGYKLLSWHH